MKRLQQNIENKNNHYLYPFFWQHGESNEKIKEYMDKMREQGIYHVCVESRPHPQFLEDGWWHTMDFIIKEAQEHNMNVWILDDVKFPTGYVNGKVPDHLKKQYLNYKRYDIVGPNPYAEINLTMPSGMRALWKDERHKKDTIYKVMLTENDITEERNFYEDTIEDVTHLCKDGILHLSLDKKHYSVFVLYKTICGEEEATKDYLDPMRKEATQVLIDEVYEKHYSHYHTYFGTIIKGFFSDEPRFGNIKGMKAFIGKDEMPLPWNQQVEEKLEIYGKEVLFLFVGTSEKAKQMRYIYMDMITKLYSENFSKVIGNWCASKGVEYVGHVIEDNNIHTGLGYGAGHFFRSIAGQSMAGIDIIGGQIVPGMDYHHDAFSTGGSDGGFYHYALCKLGASAAKLDPNKKGMLMCEAFGAYGWVAGLKMMKWITDHMLSHGVNVIVPHAFSPKEFPDWDCPPHFYAHGNNPQYRYFHKWSHYADRLCHLLSGGYQVCNIGVLYHAFASWYDDSMLIQTVLKQLQIHQIDSNVISEDYLLEANVRNNHYWINGYGYKTLIIPYMKRLPEVLINKIDALSKQCQVIFIDAFPNNYENTLCKVCGLSNITELLEGEVTLSSKEEKLVYYHYQQTDGNVYMFTNEDIMHTIETTVTLKTVDDVMIYDAYNNIHYALEYSRSKDTITFALQLPPYQSLVLVTGKSDHKKVVKGKCITKIDSPIEVALKPYNQDVYQDPFIVTNLSEVQKKFPHFSGEIKYTISLTLEKTDVLLQIDDVYEIVEVIVNGKSSGTCIVPAYIFDISQHAVIGVNKIEIIVINTLSRNLRDPMSSYLALEPLGIVGSITILERLVK